MAGWLLLLRVLLLAGDCSHFCRRFVAERYLCLRRLYSVFAKVIPLTQIRPAWLPVWGRRRQTSSTHRSRKPSSRAANRSFLPRGVPAQCPGSSMPIEGAVGTVYMAGVELGGTGGCGRRWVCVWGLDDGSRCRMRRETARSQ